MSFSRRARRFFKILQVKDLPCFAWGAYPKRQSHTRWSAFEVRDMDRVTAPIQKNHAFALLRCVQAIDVDEVLVMDLQSGAVV